MAASGGIELQTEYDLLQAELENFFGQQNEIRAGLKPEEPITPKPPELIRYEMIKKTGLHVWEGGLMDQPHIWLGQFGVIDNLVQLYASLERARQEAEKKSEEKNGSNTK